MWLEVTLHIQAPQMDWIHSYGLGHHSSRGLRTFSEAQAPSLSRASSRLWAHCSTGSTTLGKNRDGVLNPDSDAQPLTVVLMACSDITELQATVGLSAEIKGVGYQCPAVLHALHMLGCSAGRSPHLYRSTFALNHLHSFSWVLFGISCFEASPSEPQGTFLSCMLCLGDQNLSSHQATKAAEIKCKLSC